MADSVSSELCASNGKCEGQENATNENNSNISSASTDSNENGQQNLQYLECVEDWSFSSHSGGCSDPDKIEIKTSEYIGLLREKIQKDAEEKQKLQTQLDECSSKKSLKANTDGKEKNQVEMEATKMAQLATKLEEMLREKVLNKITEKSKLKTQLDELRAEIGSLKADLDAKEKKQMETESAKAAQLAEKLKENTQLKLQLSNCVEMFREQIGNEAAEKNKLKTELDECRAEIALLKVELANMKKKQLGLEAAQSAQLQQTEKLKKLEQVVKQTREKLDLVESNRRYLRERVNKFMEAMSYKEL